MFVRIFVPITCKLSMASLSTEVTFDLSVECFIGFFIAVEQNGVSNNPSKNQQKLKIFEK